MLLSQVDSRQPLKFRQFLVLSLKALCLSPLQLGLLHGLLEFFANMFDLLLGLFIPRDQLCSLSFDFQQPHPEISLITHLLLDHFATCSWLTVRSIPIGQRHIAFLLGIALDYLFYLSILAWSPNVTPLVVSSFGFYSDSHFFNITRDKSTTCMRNRNGAMMSYSNGIMETIFLNAGWSCCFSMMPEEEQKVYETRSRGLRSDFARLT